MKDKIKIEMDWSYGDCDCCGMYETCDIRVYRAGNLVKELNHNDHLGGNIDMNNNQSLIEGLFEAAGVDIEVSIDTGEYNVG